MTKDYLFITASVLLLALGFAATKAYQKENGSDLVGGLKYNAILGAVTAALFFIGNGFRCEFHSFSVMMAVATSTLTVSYTLVGFKIMEQGSMAFYMIFLMTGGMIMPYLWGLIFLEEPLSLLRTVGLIALVVSTVISNQGSGKANTKQIFMCVAVFILNGFTSVVSKEHQISASSVPAIDFLILDSLAKMVICTVLYLLLKKKQTNPRKKESLKGFLFIPVVAATGGGSYLLQLIGAEHLPATVLYPMVTGGTIIFTAVAGRVFFKEKISKKMALAILICVIGTCMFL